MKKIIKIGIIVAAVIAVYSIASISYAIGGLDKKVYKIESGSMVPAIYQNDAVSVDTNYPFEKLEIGDIILFKAPGNSSKTIVSRIVKLQNDSEGQINIVTKGDANPGSIPGIDFMIKSSNYIGKVTKIISMH